MTYFYKLTIRKINNSIIKNSVRLWANTIVLAKILIFFIRGPPLSNGIVVFLLGGL
jgi:hypothetical protein